MNVINFWCGDAEYEGEMITEKSMLVDEEKLGFSDSDEVLIFKVDKNLVFSYNNDKVFGTAAFINLMRDLTFVL